MSYVAVSRWPSWIWRAAWSRSGRVVIGLAVSAVLLWLASRSVHWGQLLDAMAGIHVGHAAIALLALLATYAVFSVRWAILLPQAPGASSVSVLPSVMVGYFVNTVTPFRLGDIARAVVLNRRHPIGISTAIGAIYAEHLIDAIFLLGTVALFAAVTDIPSLARTVLIADAVIVIVAALLLVAMSPAKAVAWLIHVPDNRGRAQTLFRRLVKAAAEFNSGFEALRKPRTVLGIGAWSAVVWALIGLTSVEWAHALGLAVPWQAAVFSVALAGLAAMVPITPAAIGTYELAIVIALSPWDPDPSRAFAFAMIIHAAQAAANIVLGGLFALRHGGGLSPSSTSKDDASGNAVSDTH